MILLVNACVRRDSRTKILAERLLAKLKEDTESNPENDIKNNAENVIEELRLEDMAFPVADEAFLHKRDALLVAGEFADPMFAPARQFASADTIVIAAPYWDLSFPAALKQYIEQVNVVGITFEYTPEGFPRGLCRAKKLYYVMTAGGTYVPEEFGYGYVKALAQNFYGIQDVELIKAVGLDIIGADVNKIIGEAEV